MRRLFGFFKQRFLRFRREAVVLWFAFRHPATPRYLKVASLLTALYLLSPIDLIPFAIPVLGVVDDIIIVPMALSWIVKRLPPQVRVTAEERTTRFVARYVKRPLLLTVGVLVALVTFWALALWGIYYFFFA